MKKVIFVLLVTLGNTFAQFSAPLTPPTAGSAPEAGGVIEVPGFDSTGYPSGSWVDVNVAPLTKDYSAKFDAIIAQLNQANQYTYQVYGSMGDPLTYGAHLETNTNHQWTEWNNDQSMNGTAAANNNRAIANKVNIGTQAMRDADDAAGNVSANYQADDHANILNQLPGSAWDHDFSGDGLSSTILTNNATISSLASSLNNLNDSYFTTYQWGAAEGTIDDIGVTGPLASVIPTPGPDVSAAGSPQALYIGGKTYNVPLPSVDPSVALAIQQAAYSALAALVIWRRVRQFVASI